MSERRSPSDRDDRVAPGAGGRACSRRAVAIIRILVFFAGFESPVRGRAATVRRCSSSCDHAAHACLSTVATLAPRSQESRRQVK